jgi:hypothetical protein
MIPDRRAQGRRRLEWALVSLPVGQRLTRKPDATMDAPGRASGLGWGGSHGGSLNDPNTNLK